MALVDESSAAAAAAVAEERFSEAITGDKG